MIDVTTTLAITMAWLALAVSLIALVRSRNPGPTGPPGPIGTTGPKGDVGYGMPGPMGKCECKCTRDT